MPYFDFFFFVASLALGWGLSLATYRTFAIRNQWPMGELHVHKPVVPILLGVFVLIIALLFAASRSAGPVGGGWWIVLAGLIWGVFWTAFMRVGSQIALLFAPVAAFVLCVAWISVREAPDLGDGTGYFTNSAFVETPLRTSEPPKRGNRWQ